MRLFIACLIIYAHNLHWGLYVAAFCIVTGQFLWRKWDALDAKWIADELRRNDSAQRYPALEERSI